MVTVEVPQSGGVGFRTTRTDAAGTATVRFTYCSPNGIVGSSTYSLLVGTGRNAGVDDRCLPTSCATVTYDER